MFSIHEPLPSNFAGAVKNLLELRIGNFHILMGHVNLLESAGGLAPSPRYEAHFWHIIRPISIKHVITHVQIHNHVSLTNRHPTRQQTSPPLFDFPANSFPRNTLTRPLAVPLARESRVVSLSHLGRHGDSPEILVDRRETRGDSLRRPEGLAGWPSVGRSEARAYPLCLHPLLRPFLLPSLLSLPDRARTAAIHRHQCCHELRRLRRDRQDDPGGRPLRIEEESLRLRHQQEGHSSGGHQSVSFFMKFPIYVQILSYSSV